VKHIAYVIPTLDRIGGAEQQVILLATGMAKMGWRISIIALSGAGGDVTRRFESAGITFYSLQMRKGLVDPRGWVRFHRWIRQNQPDIVHAHLPHASLLARWSRLAAPEPILIDTIHSPATGGVLRNIGYSMSAALPDVVTAVSRAAADPWLSSGMLKEAWLTIIPNGVEIDRWKRDDNIRNAMRDRLRLRDDFLWLSVGRLDPAKDHSTLLRALALLPSNTRLVILGDGQLKNQLHALVQDLGLTDRVNLPGFQAEVLPWMCAADGFVLSSRWEGLPIALLEAAACRLPAVVTDIPGVREVLPDLHDDLLAPPGDGKALAASMQAMMCLPETERHDIGLRINMLIRERFSMDAVLSHWENLYNLLLERNLQSLRFGMSARSLGRILKLQ
jgi:glycosyltransferase involved in cell wall biosynthesis